MTALHTLSPDAVGVEAARAVAKHVGRLAMPLSPGVALHMGTADDAALAATDLALTVAQLCRWAQSGALGDWTDHEDAADALLTASGALYRAPAGGDASWTADDLAGAIDAGSAEPVALVMAGCLARLRVCRGEAATVADLAVLAGLSTKRLHALVASGELAATRGVGASPTTVAPDEARRWLAARGLRGWSSDGGA